jgi:hypothetical protein
MNFTIIGAALCLAAATVSASAFADEHRKTARENRQQGSDMQAVPVAAKDGEPGHDWRYFSDARMSRAIVISPGGDYYYSQGAGLEVVYRASPGA